MRIQKAGFLAGFISLVFFGVLLSCATDPAALQVENSLPQNKLAFYNDSFDNLRENLWDRAGYLFRDEQMRNFKQADMRSDNGKLIIRTQTGSFSKGGLTSRFALRGDFDIQLDCRIGFLKGVSGMDQVLTVLVIDKTGVIGKLDSVRISLTMNEGELQALFIGRALINGRWNYSDAIRTENFDGTLRFIRKRKHISTLYKNRNESAWNKIHTVLATKKDMRFGFAVTNFVVNRPTIEAAHSITAEFDSFKITLAEGIIEDEI